MKAAILAMSALVGMMGMAACNREAKSGGQGGAADTSGSASTTDRIKEEAREAGREIGQATDKAVDKTKEEARQTTRDVKEGAEKLVSKTEQGAKQAGGAAKEKSGAAKEKVGAATESGGATKGIGGSGGDSGGAAGAADAAANKAGGAANAAGGSAKAAANGLMPWDDVETPSDFQLVVKIRQQLAADKEIAADARDIQIDADNGKVELEGTVTSKEIKAKINRVVGRLAGEKNVEDELRVAERVGTGNVQP